MLSSSSIILDTVCFKRAKFINKKNILTHKADAISMQSMQNNVETQILD